MAQPPKSYLPVPAELVDRERKVTRDWLLVFEQFAARIFASGTVVGPSVSTNNAIALYDGVSGQILKAASGTGVVHATGGVYGTANVALTSEVTGVLPIANGGGLSGTYTPTLTIVANLDAVTAYVCQWLRVGDVVTVTGQIDVNPTAGALTTVALSLPVASALTLPTQCAGVAAAPAIAGQVAAVLGDAVNDRALLQWTAIDLTLQAMYFTFSYRVL